MEHNSAEKNNLTNLQDDAEASKIIQEHIKRIITAEDFDEAVYDMLETFGSYIKAERMYIFEDKGALYQNTYVWYAQGAPAQMRNLQEPAREKLTQWIGELEKGNYIFVPDAERVKDSQPDFYRLLVEQNIRSAVEVPIMIDGKLAGFLGADNAPGGLTKLIIDALYILAIFLSNVMQVRQEQQRIKEKNRELELEKKRYREALSNKCEYCFSFDVTEGLLYEDVTTAHGIDLVKFLGLSLPARFDEMNEKYFSAYGLKILNGDMESGFTCDGLLQQYEQGNTNVELEYYSPVSDIYSRASALLSEDEATGHVHAVVIANDISKVRKKEEQERHALIESKEQLSSTNRKMSLQLETVLSGIAGGFKISRNDSALSYEYVSEGLAAIQGYTVKEFMEATGGSALENCYLSDRECVKALIDEQYKEGDSYSVKYRVRHKDGSLKWVVDSGKRVTEEDGNICHYSLIQDVTEIEARSMELKNANSMQAQLMTSINCGVFAYTLPDRKVIVVNDAAREIMECGDDDIFSAVGDFYRNRMVPEDYRTVSETISRLKEPGDAVSYTFRVKKKNGDMAVVQCSTKRLDFADGRPYILSSLMDITEETNLQALLAAERGQYRDAILEGAEFSFAADLMEEELSEDWTSTKKLVPFPDDAEDILNRKVLLKKYEEGDMFVEAEYYSGMLDKYYSIRVLLSQSPKDGHIHAIFVVYDITEKEKEQQRQTRLLMETKTNLSMVNEELRQALSSEKEKTAVISAMGNIYHSTYMVDLKSRNIGEVSGSGTIGRYICGQGGAEEAFRQWITNVVHENFWEEMTSFTDLLTLPERMKDSQIISRDCQSLESGWIRISFIVVDRDEKGTVERVLLVSQHIDAEKQKELSQQEALKTAYAAANRANAAKTKFLASMSHDIRTPMNAIIGMTAIAGTHLDDKERVSDCLGKITVSSKHLLGLINEVLDMSKIESGKIDLNEEEFSLPELIDNLLSMVKPQIDAKKHDLAVTIKGIEHENVVGDSQRIQQSFMNLMSNAVKYTPSGGKIKLTISEKPMNKPKVGCYEFIFEDNGIGMSEEFASCLFDPFTRAADNRVANIQGTGLGMAITRNIVQMMNGDIHVESELDKGTKITVTIVLQLQEEKGATSYEEFVDLPILVVDDDELACESTCEVLEELGMEGEWVLSGQEAVERVTVRHEKDDDFFAVIVDWKMPGMDGLETTKAIRARVGNDVPIIIISAYDWSDIELEARAAGANAFISKPLFKSRMVHLFNELLGNGQKEDSGDSLDEIIKEDFKGFRALLVEDNELNAEIAGEILEMTGLAVCYAADGKEALDKVSSAADGYYDIIFMDVQMPVMNGYDATTAIRSLPGDYVKRVPIIAMTANAFTDDIQDAKRAGMNQHMAKPINFNQLMEILHRWLG